MIVIKILLTFVLNICAMNEIKQLNRDCACVNSNLNNDTINTGIIINK